MKQTVSNFQREARLWAGISILLFIIAIMFTVAAITYPTTPAPQEQSEQACIIPPGPPATPEYLADYVYVDVTYATEPLNPDTHAPIQWAYDPRTGISACIVYINVPQHVSGDPDMAVLGHQFMHCLTGFFHE